MKSIHIRIWLHLHWIKLIYILINSYANFFCPCCLARIGLPKVKCAKHIWNWPFNSWYRMWTPTCLPLWRSNACINMHVCMHICMYVCIRSNLKCRSELFVVAFFRFRKYSLNVYVRTYLKFNVTFYIISRKTQNEAIKWVTHTTWIPYK